MQAWAQLVHASAQSKQCATLRDNKLSEAAFTGGREESGVLVRMEQ
jgi:hypothetical protein